MPAVTRTNKILAVSSAAAVMAAFILIAPQPAFAGKKTDKVLLGVAAGAAGVALLHALSKNKRNNARPPVTTSGPRSRPPRGYYPRHRPRPPVYARPRPPVYARPRPPVYAPPRPQVLYSPNTVRIQQSLAALGYNVGIADGLMGRSTRAGISQFQTSLGQNPTGYMTPQQQNALFQQAAGGGAPQPGGYPAAGYPPATGYPVNAGYPPATTGYPPAATGYPTTPGYRPPVAQPYPAPVTPGYRPPAPRPYPPTPGYRPPVPGYSPISATPGYPVPASRGRGIPVTGLNPSRDTTAALRVRGSAPRRP